MASSVINWQDLYIVLFHSLNIFKLNTLKYNIGYTDWLTNGTENIGSMYKILSGNILESDIRSD